MDDKKLFETWKVPEAQEKMVFENHEGTYEQLAKRRSNDIFRRIKRNVIIELIITFIIVILPFALFPMLPLDEIKPVPIYLEVLIVIVGILPLIGFVIQVKYLRDIKNINKVSIKTSLKSKLVTLSSYIKHMNFITGVIIPICIFISFFSGVFYGIGDLSNINNDKLFKLLGIIGVSIIVMFIVIWLFKKIMYKLYYKFYGKHIERIQKIHDNLLEEEIIS